MSKTILISGASSGLGRSLATLLKEKGYEVFGTSRNPDKYDLPFSMVRMDLESADSIQQAVEAVIQQSGRVDVLINNAGIGLAGPAEHATLGGIGKLFQTNTTGAFLLGKAVFPHMRKQQAGKIINISSLGAALGLPYRSLYCASKAALDVWSDSLRMELGQYGIQSTSVWCGDLITPIGDRRIQEVNLDDPTYRDSFLRVYKGINEDVHKGMPSEVAAKKIAQIVGKNKLKRRYKVAKPIQKLSVLAKAILPDATFDQVINRFSNL